MLGGGGAQVRLPLSHSNWWYIPSLKLLASTLLAATHVPEERLDYAAMSREKHDIFERSDHGTQFK